MRIWMALFWILCLPFAWCEDTVAERTTLLNEDFTLYMKETSLRNVDRAMLDYNLGNLYTQFGEYPWAILYYEKALKHKPRDPDILSNRAFAQERLHLAQAPETIVERLFSLYPRLSLQESWEFAGGCLLLAIMLSSFYIWGRLRFLKLATGLVVAMAFFFSVQALYLQYFAPLEGIMVRSSYLYKGAGKNYSLVMGQPLFSGVKVKIVEVNTKGKWLKVETEQKQVGYVFFDSIRII